MTDTNKDDLDLLIERLQELRAELPKGVKVHHHDAEWGVYPGEIVVARITEEHGHRQHHTDETISAFKALGETLPGDEALAREWEEMSDNDREYTAKYTPAADVDGWIALRKEQRAEFERTVEAMETGPIALVMVAKHLEKS